MPEFDENSVQRLFESSLKDAKSRLRSLRVCGTTDPEFRGLTGWVFEQTVLYCLRREMQAKGVQAEIQQQVSLGGRISADCAIGPVAIEIKARGIFNRSASSRYRRYSAAALRRGYSYLYVTLGESHAPYRKAMVDAVGRKNAFFLDRPGQWRALVQRTLALQKVAPINSVQRTRLTPRR